MRGTKGGRERGRGCVVSDVLLLMHVFELTMTKMSLFESVINLLAYVFTT